MDIDSEWMGRYRPFVAALVRHSNLSSRVAARRTVGTHGQMVLAPNEWQTLEYLLEHQDEVENMVYISNQLGIATSTFSRIVRALEKLDFVEKFKKVGNNKDIVLHITQAGRDYYYAEVKNRVIPLFEGCFAHLGGLSNEQLEQVTQAIDHISALMLKDTQAAEKEEPPQLVPLRQNMPDTDNVIIEKCPTD